jgi:hypothetical protein
MPILKTLLNSVISVVRQDLDPGFEEADLI